MKTETNTSPESQPSTTFNTWGRVAEDHMQRMSELFEQTNKMQTAAIEQGRQLFAYNMKLATEWQNWASETGRNLAKQFLSTAKLS